MLVRDEWESPFPDNDLTYLAFLCGAWQALERLRALRRDPRSPLPSLFLPAVPLLEDLPEAVDLDVLAATWARHRSDDAHLASLLDAAVIFAGSGVAADLVLTGRGWVRNALRQGARQLDLRLDAWTSRHVRLQLDRWWPGLEFDVWQDTAELSGFLEDQVRPLVEARGRRTASPTLGANLRGLLRDDVVRDLLRLLQEP
jgi:hypothetical protein